MRHLSYLIGAALLASYSILAVCAPANSAPQKRMQVGKPFTLILHINPTGTPAKVDSLLAAGNKILLGHGKGEFNWYIAKTPNKWAKLTSGSAVTGVPATLALSYDGQTLRSYYNNVLAASMAVSSQQFNGLVSIKLNDWLGEYHSAVAYAKVLNIKQIEMASAQSTSSSEETTKPSESTTNEPDTTKPSNPTTGTDTASGGNSVTPDKPVETTDVDPTQPTDVTPVEPNTDQPDTPTPPEETTKPLPSEPDVVEPVTPVEPVEPVKPIEPVAPVEPTNLEPSSPSEPADLNPSTVKQITVTVKVLAVTATPEPDKILPYKHAIVTQEVEVLSVDKGSLMNIKKGDKLRLARWGILQGQKTEVAKTKVGDKITLPLESYKDHEELERQYTVDTLPESYELPYLLDVTE